MLEHAGRFLQFVQPHEASAIGVLGIQLRCQCFSGLFEMSDRLLAFAFAIFKDCQHGVRGRFVRPHLQQMSQHWNCFAVTLLVENLGATRQRCHVIGRDL